MWHGKLLGVHSCGQQWAHSNKDRCVSNTIIEGPDSVPQNALARDTVPPLRRCPTNDVTVCNRFQKSHPLPTSALRSWQVGKREYMLNHEVELTNRMCQWNVEKFEWFKNAASPSYSQSQLAWLEGGPRGKLSSSIIFLIISLWSNFGARDVRGKTPLLWNGSWYDGLSQSG
jgi:hypothetical protein